MNHPRLVLLVYYHSATFACSFLVDRVGGLEGESLKEAFAPVKIPEFSSGIDYF